MKQNSLLRETWYFFLSLRYRTIFRIYWNFNLRWQIDGYYFWFLSSKMVLRLKKRDHSVGEWGAMLVVRHLNMRFVNLKLNKKSPIIKRILQFIPHFFLSFFLFYLLFFSVVGFTATWNRDSPNDWSLDIMRLFRALPQDFFFLILASCLII